MGEEVEVYEDYQIEPRYNSLNKLAKELLSDFKEVDDNFKGIIKEIYERQTENAEKKALLNYIIWRTKTIATRQKFLCILGVSALGRSAERMGRVDWCTLQNAGK